MNEVGLRWFLGDHILNAQIFSFEASRPRYYGRGALPLKYLLFILLYPSNDRTAALQFDVANRFFLFFSLVVASTCVCVWVSPVCFSTTMDTLLRELGVRERERVLYGQNSLSAVQCMSNKHMQDSWVSCAPVLCNRISQRVFTLHRFPMFSSSLCPTLTFFPYHILGLPPPLPTTSESGSLFFFL